MDTTYFTELDACEPAIEYLAGQPDWPTAVKNCDRVEWFTWLFKRVEGPAWAEYSRAQYGPALAEYQRVQAMLVECKRIALEYKP